MRVLEILSQRETAKALRYKIPKECQTIPPALLEIKTHYPTSLMKSFPKPDQYLMLGVLTEYLLRLPIDEIHPENLKMQCQTLFSIEIPQKTLALSSTLQYLTQIKNTRALLDQHTTQHFSYDQTLQIETVEGHPDIVSGSDIFEVKTTGQIKPSWTSFLLQVFAYAAIDLTATRVHLVFPLSAYIWSFDLKNWDLKKRNTYRKLLTETKPIDTTQAAQIFSTYKIGTHVQKKKTLPDSILGYDIPIQIFLGSPTGLGLKEPDAKELQDTRDLVRANATQLFIHAPYTINLSDMTDAATTCLTKQLEIGAAIKAKGVVVHVGKHCNRFHSEVARNRMKMAIQEALKAGHDCPLLLETPAGQGTELLVPMKEFIDFALETSYELTPQELPNFGICLDTCHVFAGSHCPREYMIYTLAHAKPLLKLIHFNDSLGTCGSCVDRHAIICCGKIDKQVLIDCAELATEHSIPMLTE